MIVTSSSDKKLERARALGAAAGINYRTHADWPGQVRDLTNGEGADLVVDSAGSLVDAVNAVRVGGTVSFVGLLGDHSSHVDLVRLMGTSATIHAIDVGSRAMFEAMNAFIESTGLRPVIDRVFEFEEAHDAFRYFASGTHFGNVCIRGPRSRGKPRLLVSRHRTSSGGHRRSSCAAPTTARDTATQLTFDTADDRHPVWTPDGKRITFDSDRAKPARRISTGSTRTARASRRDSPTAGQSGGHVLASGRQASGLQHPRLNAAADGGRCHGRVESRYPPRPFLPRRRRTLPAFWPDGRFVAYGSSEGRTNGLDT